MQKYFKIENALDKIKFLKQLAYETKYDDTLNEIRYIQNKSSLYNKMNSDDEVEFHNSDQGSSKS